MDVRIVAGRIVSVPCVSCIAVLYRSCHVMARRIRLLFGIKLPLVCATIKERLYILSSIIFDNQDREKETTCMESRSALSSAIDFAALQSRLLLATCRIARVVSSPELSVIKPYC